MPAPRALPLAALAPAFTRPEALAAGVTDDQLRSSRVRRVSTGLYVPADSALTAPAALARVLPDDAAYSHVTALALLGLPTPYSLRGERHVHVTVAPRSVLPRRQEMVVHSRSLKPTAVVVVDGLRVTSASRTFLDLAAALTDEDLVALGDAILRLRLASPATLAAATAAAAGRRGIARVRRVVPLLDGRAQSIPESLLRIRLMAAGLPVPEPQCAVRDRNGVVFAHVDLGYREQRVGMEYEGRGHAEGAQFDRDLDRYTELSALGWLILRASRRDLSGQSRVFVEQVRAALRRRGLAV